MTEATNINFKTALKLLNDALDTRDLAEQIYIQQVDSFTEVADLILKTWAKLAIFKNYMLEKPNSDALLKLPSEPAVFLESLDSNSYKFPKKLSEELWKEDLRKLFDAASRITVEAGKSEVNIQHHLDLLSNVLNSECLGCYRHFGVKTPVKKLMYVGAGVAAIVALVFGIREALRPPDPFIARFYNNPELQGEPAASKKIKDVNLDWTWEEPAAGFGLNNYSVRIDTCLSLEDAATLKADLGSDDGSRLYIDSDLVIDQWRPQGFTSVVSERQLNPGVYNLKTEFFQLAGSSKLVLKLSIDNKVIGEPGTDVKLFRPTIENGQAVCKLAK